MQKSRNNGYTLIEVMLVLAISSLLFIGATSIFGSRRSGVEFTQSIYDIESKVKQYSTQVSTGNFLETSDYTCSQLASTQRPILKLEASSSNSNQDCIYIGKALLPVIGSGDIYIYDVLGLRNIHNGLVDTGESVQDVADAKPEPAGYMSAANVFTYLFSEKYTLQNGATIISATNNGNPAGILKIFSTLQNNNTSSRGITAYSNNFTYAAGDEQTGAESNSRLRNCIEGIGGCSNDPVSANYYKLDVNAWNLCLRGADDSKKAILNIKPSANGLVTKVNVTNCS
jgi:prepilin-type N-terminal cleavage/methylation domain-containing protein